MLASGVTKNMHCPCDSGKLYALCCQPFHQGKQPDNALKLMRSRYSAYALCLPDYIILTTHPANSQYRSETAQWSEKILEFCKATKFEKLEILDFQENGNFATVTFHAQLHQVENDTSFTEKSIFEKLEGRWLYRSGQLSKGPG
jgi:SEC-C motif domain protein